MELDELKNKFNAGFRAKQIYHWLYHKYIDSYEQMSNIPKVLKEQLSSGYSLSPLKMLKRLVSQDGSIKYLFELHDGHTVETVVLLMKQKQYHEDGALKHQERYTVCISSQVGCKVGCAFCLTAKGGFVRDLTPGEIVEQVRWVKKDLNLEPNRRLNVVYMGMGEPLDNLESVVKSVRILSEDNGLDISPKRQTISTSGLSSKIEKLASYDTGINLAISLHAVDNKTRQMLMPINKAYNIESIIEVVKNFPINQRKRIMFEYLLIKDVNDSIAEADKLVTLLNGINAKVNLILFNPYDGVDFKRPNDKDVERFKNHLNAKGLCATIRESKGMDILAACGQLREYEKEEIENG